MWEHEHSNRDAIDRVFARDQLEFGMDIRYYNEHFCIYPFDIPSTH